MSAKPVKPDIRLRLVFGPDEVLGPGKAELLERIARTGSIAAAGRQMGMSYKRAWQLVDTMNAMFRAPLVHSTRGGARGGGASLSALGQQVLGHYRDLQAGVERAGAAALDDLAALRPDIPGRK